MTWRTFLTARSSQSSLIKLGALAAAGLSVALLAAACTVTSGTDGNPGGGTPGGSGGTDGMAGSGSGGDSSTGGAVGTGGGGGMGSADVFDCHPGGVVSGSPASTDPAANDDECWACIKEQCPDEFANCQAVEPYSVCGWNEPAPGTEGGEIDCMFECFDDLYDQEPRIFAGTQDDVDDCIEQCGGTAECGSSEPSSVTVALAACTIGVTSDNPAGCQDECGWPIEEEM